MAMAQCPEWSAEFASPGADNVVYAKSTAQVGGIEHLLLGGAFNSVGGVVADGVALYDGVQWTALGSGLPGTVLAVAQYDDGSGALIYAGGNGFLSSWDGLAWTTVSVDGEILALHVHDDGQGLALYAGGDFDSIGPKNLRDIGRYDGTWDKMNAGTANSGAVLALATHDDGSGPALYVGGLFSQVGGVPADRLARWDGTTFNEVGGGIDGQHGRRVRALASYTPSGGVAELHVGGNFLGAGGIATSDWIAWSQAAWIDIGGNGVIESFTCHEELSGSTIVAARNEKVVSYDGVSRTNLNFAMPSGVTVLASFGTGVPAVLFAGTAQLNESGSFLARRENGEWKPLISGPGQGLGLPSYVYALALHDFGQGERLLAMSASGVFPGQQVAQYDGNSWSELNADVLDNQFILDAHSHLGDLYLAGTVTFEGFSVKRLQGSSWEELGTSSGVDVQATSLETFDDGAGPELYVGLHRPGDITVAGTSGVARFDGTDWVSVGGGITMGYPGISNLSVFKILEWNDGNGSDLYVAGRFLEAGGVPTNSIARWDGTSWSALGAGVLPSGTITLPYIYDMVAFNGPTGHQLIVSGRFELMGTQVVNSIAAWDGSSWSPLGSGLTSFGEPGFGHQLIAHDPDGLGERLFVTGGFSTAGGVPVDNAAVWDGVSWAATTLPNNTQSQMEIYDDGTGRALFIAGGFDEVNGVASKNIAKLTDPCGAILGVPSCTANPNSTGLLGTTRARGVASVSAANITVEARNLPANAFTLFFAGTGLQQGIAGDGVLCVAGSLTRMQPGAFADANGLHTQTFDFQAPYAGNAIPGQSLVIQGFYRDNAGGPVGFNTTDAIEILLQP